MTDSFHKLDMASADWLTTHFLAKSADRFRKFAELPIRRGDHVLDLCCGAGLYIPYILDLVGPTGMVTGLDQDSMSLDVAHRKLSVLPHKNWRLVHSNVESYLAKFDQFDVVLIFNCIGYFSSPLQLVRSIADRLPRRSRIIVKDFDLESFFFHPRDFEMWSCLVKDAKERNDRDNPVKFDNFFGRHVFGLHLSGTFTARSNFIWTQSMVHPFNEYEREYIWQNIECLIKQAEVHCEIRVIDYFKQMFHPQSSAFFHSPDAMFLENEFLTVLEV
jgi:ubiquinone/menaquinone biosynthesis C-methylase UbiE